MPKHLDLPLILGEFTVPKKKNTFIPQRNERSSTEKEKFLVTSTEMFNAINHDLQEKKKKFSTFLNPNLIFKIRLNNKESENSFREELERSNIQILSPSPDAAGYWIAFSTDIDLEAFKKRLRDYATDKHKYAILNSIEDFTFISRNEKLKAVNIDEIFENNIELKYFDVEVWRMQDKLINKFLTDIEVLINSTGSKITDKLIRRNFCLFRVYGNRSAMENILDCNEVCSVELPQKPKVEYSYLLGQGIDDFEILNSLNDKSPIIAVLDSGIVSNHPLFIDAVAMEIPDLKGRISDDTSHGTKVAGIVMYGDIAKCIQEKKFEQHILIISAKIMYNNGNNVPVYDEDKLLEHQLLDIVAEVKSNFPNCRVFNLSIGNSDNLVYNIKRQYNLPVLLDELSKDFNIIFTVPTGNISLNENDDLLDDYPNYYSNDSGEFKIIDPASSALAITVGSLAYSDVPYQSYGNDLYKIPARFNHPSPFTRSGPGFNGMIKPELVEYGGNIMNSPYRPTNNLQGKILSLNKNFLTNGSLFAADIGSSFSCPKVANHLGMILNKYPNYSNNMIKALLLSSADIPQEKPNAYNGISLEGSDSELLSLLNLYGFGLPNIEEALESKADKVLLLRENQIALNTLHLYSILLPDSLLDVSGRKTISVTLVYDPPINKNRLDYLNCTMAFKLYKNIDIKDVKRAYNSIEVNDSFENITIDNKYEIKLCPKNSLRKKGVHQKAWKIYDRINNKSINNKFPLTLAVFCKNNSVQKNDYLQDYSVIVKIEHTGNTELYNTLRLKNIVRTQLRG